MPVLKDWNDDDKPREKAVQLGMEALSSAELLALLFGNGSIGISAVDLGRALLDKTDSLTQLGQLSVAEMTSLKIKGLGPAKAITVLAALELGNRRNLELDERRLHCIRSGKDAALYLQKKMRHFQHEVFVVLFLNQGNRVIAHDTISSGGITATVVDARIILRKALSYSAVSILLCHNHPSGNIQPSHSDLELTQKLRKGAAYLDIQVLDHIIVSTEGYYSFLENGQF